MPRFIVTLLSDNLSAFDSQTVEAADAADARRQVGATPLGRCARDLRVEPQLSEDTMVQQAVRLLLSGQSRDEILATGWMDAAGNPLTPARMDAAEQILADNPHYLANPYSFAR